MSESLVEFPELLESSSEQVEEVQSSTVATVAPVDYTEALNNIQLGIFMNAFLLAAVLGAFACSQFFKGV